MVATVGNGVTGGNGGTGILVVVVEDQVITDGSVTVVLPRAMVEALVQQELISNSLLVISLLMMKVEYSSCINRCKRSKNILPKPQELLIMDDNACIDDARWQRFLDLARDGTQDYRLTATENNSTVKIVNATEKNIYKMMNANSNEPLRTSLTDWYHSQVIEYLLLVLAWDETSG